MLRIGLNPNYCVGIGADGCSVNTSENVGAIQEIQKTAVNAVRAPCQNHILNLSISKASVVPAVKKAVHKHRPRDHRRLVKTFHRCLPKLCETRWVERHEAVQVFHDGFSEVTAALHSICKWKDTDSSGKANTLITVIHQPEFIVTLVCLRDVLPSTVSLPRFLQKEVIDMEQASNAVQDTISVLEEKRRNSEEMFGVLFQEAKDLAKEHDIDLQNLPRSAGRGRNPTAEAESFYWQTVYNAMIDNIVVDLKLRLSKEVLECFKLNLLIPSVMLEDENGAKAALEHYAEKYESLLETPRSTLLHKLKAEWGLWRPRWLRHKDQKKVIPSTCIGSIDECDADLFPIIRELLLVLLALPSSIATAERSFSTLRRLKTYLRSVMKNDRLNGLALLAVHRDIPVDKEKVIDRLPAKNLKRKQKLAI
ncbi:52 kDa repressor of the inhibitor of the protein kinase [Frankliniella fusca]|uniref:52 kDa repressor of the inhibitor of the protein kinase n=1 Tax=Frankliniella fusca TaxID=407009 RepID=A0AAE1LDT0_9NEOP|nr:52 kDa repressor of the inhibitor of the protein kinase [Frankliniella fusca]